MRLMSASLAATKWGKHEDLADRGSGGRSRLSLATPDTEADGTAQQRSSMGNAVQPQPGALIAAGAVGAHVLLGDH
jgi:hypothetical protein